MKAAITKRTVVCLAIAAVALGSSLARAGATDPTLALGQLTASPAGAAAIVEITGIFGFDDVIQVTYPLNLVVYQGTAFTRYQVGSQPQSGSFAGLADGLDTTEVAALEGSGQAEANAEILRIEPNRVQVSLPTGFADGIVAAVLYVELPGEGTFTSNTLSTVLAGVAGGGP